MSDQYISGIPHKMLLLIIEIEDEAVRKSLYKQIISLIDEVNEYADEMFAENHNLKLKLKKGGNNES